MSHHLALLSAYAVLPSAQITLSALLILIMFGLMCGALAGSGFIHLCTHLIVHITLDLPTKTCMLIEQITYLIGCLPAYISSTLLLSSSPPTFQIPTFILV